MSSAISTEEADTPSNQTLHEENLTEKHERSPTPTETHTGTGLEKAQDSEDDSFLVKLDPSEDPVLFSPFKKWLVVMVISAGSFCVTCASSMASFTEQALAEEFHVSREPTILMISLFVLGLGVGPLITGPFSEVYGRSIIYQVSYVLLVLFSLPVVFAPDLGVALTFRFLLGAAGASFLSVAGGSIADLFSGPQVRMSAHGSLYHVSGTQFLGPGLYTIRQSVYVLIVPSLRAIIVRFHQSEFVLEMDVSDLDYLELCPTYYHFPGLFSISKYHITPLKRSMQFVPETYAPVLLRRKSRRLRKETGDERYWAPLDRHEINFAQSLLLSCYVPFSMSHLTPFIFAMLNLFFRASDVRQNGPSARYLDCSASRNLVPDVPGLSDHIRTRAPLQRSEHRPHLSGHRHRHGRGSLYTAILGQASLSQASASSVLAKHKYRHHARAAAANGGKAPPETLLVMGQVGGIMVPLSLYWFAFTTYPRVHWVVPIIASIPFGTGTFFVFTATFTYLVTAYRPIAASAMAANSALRSSFAAAFPLFAGAMYNKLGTVGATALLAGLATIMVPLPFIFYRMGPELRAKSRFAV
ncbi:unnamed protein product [Mycena citricolor]|uniref:MFS general substrate transporter n=1 Tax=Mycena citricolor TaxID=2018698 RepID=A0AAD2GSQ8_9AGAR|nr:unnamed protein product [Mycena citricolor]